jgi:hypothetical protein
MKLAEAHVYSCKYKNTFSIIIVAQSSEDARTLFAEWLNDRPIGSGVMPLERESMRVVRTWRSEHRPIYIPGGFSI